MTLREISLFVTLLLNAGSAVTPAWSITPDILEEAFYLAAYYDEEGFIFLNWVIAPGYFIARDKISVTLNGRPLKLAMPPTQLGNRPEIYGAPSLAVAIIDDVPTEGRVVVTYQGCVDDDVWCSRMTKMIDLKTLEITSSRLE